MLEFVLVFLAIAAALVLAAYNFRAVSRLEEGTELMKEIAAAIREGAAAFIDHEYRVIAKIAVGIAVILGVVVQWYVGISFILGALMSATAGFIGMRIATIANVRVSNKARETRSLGETLKVAFQGGSVMGLSVGGFALFGLLVVYLVFGKALGQLDIDSLAIRENWIGIQFIPFTMTVSGYALGCSIIAMFDRVGGGIYTKAADMGADLVGKTEAGIPEDDPRNPATIADNVGDNVGDVAGLGADLLESYVGAIISAVVLVAYIYFTTSGLETAIDGALAQRLILYPILFAAVGLVSSVIGIGSLLVRHVSEHPHRELNLAIWTSAAMTIVLNGILTGVYFGGRDVSALGFRMGAISPWLSAIFGIGAGVAIGFLAEYYTSYDYKPTRIIAEKSIQGTALTITQGLSAGMRSTFLPVAVLAVATMGSYYFSGLYGVAMAAIGMLSFVAASVTVDSYGPIADNAGGISEMSKLDPEVRRITDKLDSVGNTTAAIGKGFAIGSAALAALSLMASYLFSQATAADTMGFELEINIINPLTLAGALIGAALPFFFSGMLIESVAKAAAAMVAEVRRQFKEMPGILTGEERPDYTKCIEISSQGALREMVKPAMVSVLVPLASGFIFGAEFVGGLLVGTTLSGIMLALFTANSGGAWDNAKKLVESGTFMGLEKGSDVHASTVVGDTVGDPLKDTVGPSLDILIKIMAVISLVMVSVFDQYNVMNLFG